VICSFDCFIGFDVIRPGSAEERKEPTVLNFNYKNTAFMAMVILLVSCCCNGQAKKTVLVWYPNPSISDFEKVAEKSAALKPYGDVQLCVSGLAQPAYFRGLNLKEKSYIQYATYASTLFSFYPPAELESVFPKKFVRKNKQIMDKRMDILEKYGLNAWFRAYEPFFLPESFYEKYPNLRGPRVDHPRRSLDPLFAPCLNQPEMQKFYKLSMAEMIKNAPRIKTFAYKTNDCACGFCWAEVLYPGANGPSNCKSVGVSKHVNSFCAALTRGAALSGVGNLKIIAGTYFSENERKLIKANCDDNVFFNEDKKIVGIGNTLSYTWPAKGIFNPLAILESLEKLAEPEAEVVLLNFRAPYSRGWSGDEEITKVIEMTADFLDNPHKGICQRFDRLRQLCTQWAGEEYSQELFQAFYDVGQAMEFAASNRFTIDTSHGVVSARLITRPLVIKPELLTEQEESYFLPYVFNQDRYQARNDYLDHHSVHRATANTVPLNRMISKLYKTGNSFENIGEKTKSSWLTKMGQACRVYAGCLRTYRNFNDLQIIRDRRSEYLKEPFGKLKIPSSLGEKGRLQDYDNDLLRSNEIIRDEIDNTTELIKLLEQTNLEVIYTATTPEGEDTFLLSPKLIAQLQMKTKLMLKYWRQAENYFPMPFLK